MSVLNVLLVFEVVLLLAAAFFWGVSLLIAGKSPDDPLSIFWRTFWKVFLRRRSAFKVAIAKLQYGKAREYEEMKQHGDVEGIKELLRTELDEHEVDDADLAAILEADADRTPELEVESTDAGRPRIAQLNVKVNPFSERDELVKIDSEGASINVVFAPEDGRSNRAVISLISGALGVKPYQVSLLKGHYRARKLVQIAGMDQERLTDRLVNFS